MEKWMPIKGYEGKYEVSSIGRVKSLKRVRSGRSGGIYPVKERILRVNKVAGGYHQVALLNGFGEKKYTLVHRLVAMSFIPNPENKPQVNHKDGIKSNNIVENLEWVTVSENAIHAINKGLFIAQRGSKRYCAKLNENEVADIKKRIYNNQKQKDIARLYNVNQVTISNIKTGSTWKHVLVSQ